MTIINEPIESGAEVTILREQLAASKAENLALTETITNLTAENESLKITIGEYEKAKENWRDKIPKGTWRSR